MYFRFYGYMYSEHISNSRNDILDFDKWMLSQFKSIAPKFNLDFMYLKNSSNHILDFVIY